MLPSVLAMLLFGVSAISGNRAARTLGGTRANFFRILIATAFLGTYAHGWGQGLSGAGLAVFFISGCVGFGIGDLALYQALPRIGSRLSIMLVHCLAAPVAAFTEWLWLGTTLSGWQILWSSTVLAGVSVALAPHEHPHLTPAKLWTGVSFGVVAAIGQGMGAVISRKAYQLTASAGESIDGMTAAYQRIWGGVLIAAAGYLVYRWRGALSVSAAPQPLADRIWPWVLVNGLAGPALGVSCYQWALATTPTGIVLPIVALTPLAIIPMSQALEGEKPTPRSILGGVIAVCGVIGLTLASRR